MDTKKPKEGKLPETVEDLVEVVQYQGGDGTDDWEVEGLGDEEDE